MTGYVVKDPEVNEFKRKRRRNKRASKYGLVASFRLSVRRPFKTKDGTKYDYFSCSAFDKSAEFIEEYIEKGDCVGIEGILLNDNYENYQRYLELSEITSGKNEYRISFEPQAKRRR